MTYNTKLYFTFSAVLLLALSGCLPMDDGRNSGGYGDPYGRYDNGYNNDPYYNDRYEWERERIRREREELKEERERLEEERERHNNNYGRPDRRPRPPVMIKPDDNCPPGFRPGDHKCTDKERKRGCKDTRAPSGRLCVAGNY